MRGGRYSKMLLGTLDAPYKPKKCAVEGCSRPALRGELKCILHHWNDSSWSKSKSGNKRLVRKSQSQQAQLNRLKREMHDIRVLLSKYDIL